MCVWKKSMLGRKAAICDDDDQAPGQSRRACGAILVNCEEMREWVRPWPCGVEEVMVALRRGV